MFFGLIFVVVVVAVWLRRINLFSKWLVDVCKWYTGASTIVILNLIFIFFIIEKIFFSAVVIIVYYPDHRVNVMANNDVGQVWLGNKKLNLESNQSVRPSVGWLVKSVALASRHWTKTCLMFDGWWLLLFLTRKPNYIMKQN